MRNIVRFFSGISGGPGDGPQIVRFFQDFQRSRGRGLELLLRHKFLEIRRKTSQKAIYQKHRFALSERRDATIVFAPAGGLCTACLLAMGRFL